MERPKTEGNILRGRDREESRRGRDRGVSQRERDRGEETEEKR